MATPASRSVTPVAPEKGVFPLDHFGECKQAMANYMSCLRESSYTAERCKHLSKSYLECRMNNGLMAEQDLGKLGFGQEEAPGRSSGTKTAGKSTQREPAAQEALAKERQGGFVAGIRPARDISTARHQ